MIKNETHASKKTSYTPSKTDTIDKVKNFPKIVLSDLKFTKSKVLHSIESVEEKPVYSELETSILNNAIKSSEQALKSYDEIIKVISLFKEHSCTTIKDVENAGLDYGSINPFACLPYYIYCFRNYLDYSEQDRKIPLEFELKSINNKNVILPFPNYLNYPNFSIEIVPPYANNQHIKLLRNDLKAGDDINDQKVLHEYAHKVAEEYNSKLLNDEGVLELLKDILCDKNAINRYYANYMSELKKDRQDLLNKLQFLGEVQKEVDSIFEENRQLKNELRYKGQATYNSLFNGVTKKQKGKIVELKKQEEEINLLTDLIMSDTTLTQDEKLEILKSITNDNLEYEINRWLGKKLTKHERRLLRVLRRIIYQMIQQKEITGIGKSIYEAEISLSTIYEEYGLGRRNCGSYDQKQTKPIQDVLFGFSTRGLHEDILFKHSRIYKTRFILQIEKIEQKVLIKKEQKEQLLGIRIAVPHFLFVSSNDLKNYYYQDAEGFKNFMAIKGMAQSEAAFNIAEYLEWFLSSNLKERSLDLSTIIEEAGLSTTYKTHKKKVLKTLEIIFNNMVKARYLIEKWSKGKGKYKQDKYILINLRYKLFITEKEKAAVIEFSNKKSTISTKNKSNN